MGKVPKLVADFCKANGCGPQDIPQELYSDEWELLSKDFWEMGKYEVEFAEVYRHIQSGRLFRFITHDLPYGITDYGMAPESLNDIVEVFAPDVVTTVYLDHDGLKSLAASRSGRWPVRE